MLVHKAGAIISHITFSSCLILVAIGQVFIEHDLGQAECEVGEWTATDHCVVKGAVWRLDTGLSADTVTCFIRYMDNLLMGGVPAL